ncbi:MAG TPA: hypothetical protein VEK74_03100 [Burkholderiaceae bacterium]|nr:hypothetical protein [Burkholderiaceae bacterium]
MTKRANLAVIIQTSSPGWLASLATAYRQRRSVELIDDARIGVDPIRDTLFDMGKKANLSHREWIAVLVALGIGIAGAYLLVMAILDPEPFSKIAFALATGGLLVAGGGFAAIRVLVGHRPPTVRVSPRGGFEIFFE